MENAPRGVPKTRQRRQGYRRSGDGVNRPTPSHPGVYSPPAMRTVMSPSERKILKAMARATCPPGEKLPAPDDAFVERVDTFLAGAPWLVRMGLRMLLWIYELGSLVYGPWLT